MKLNQTNRMMIRTASLALAFGLVSAGRAQDGVRVYRVPKERAPMSAMAGMTPVSESSLPQLTYKVPEGWAEQPAGQMRVASFKIQADGKVADVSVIPLPGAAGGDLPNVNRWRSQVGLDAITEVELAAAATKLEMAGQSAALHEVSGTNTTSGDPTRILGVIQHREGMAWFFKMTGDDALVAKNRGAFLEFLKSVNFEAPKAGGLPADHPPTGGDALPAGHPDIGASGVAGGEASGAGGERKIKWTVPNGWKEIPGGQFLYAKFTVTVGGASAAVNVSTSAGDGGGLAANVNRWRGQLGQSPWGEAELSKQSQTIDAGGAKIVIVEMKGTDARSGQASSLVGAIVPRAGATWFYKLMGDEKVVDAQKDVFLNFVKGVTY